MCGIVGILKTRPSPDPTVETKVVETMRDRMTHRGPDDAGVWDDGRCFLGHRRLSIIDLTSAGHQPMANADGTVTVVFNGEIYNHETLRAELEARGYRYASHSDTETLIHAYEEWGLAAFDRFNGMFAVAIRDTREPARPVTHLVRDRIGIKPLYLARTARGDWLFGSEIKGLLAHPDLRAQMDLTALWHYLTFIVAPAPLTLFRGIFKIPAGWRVTIDHAGRARAEQWWDCRPDASEIYDPRTVSEEECVEELLGALRASIARRMVCDVPFGVLLSGGIDSSMNVALMSELMDRPVTTFSIGYEGQAAYNEFRFAERVAKRYATDHHVMEINRRQMQDFLPTLVEMQDEPIADNVCIPLYFLAKLVKDSGTTVVQVGEGADENWLGYWWCEDYRRQYEDLYRPARRGDFARRAEPSLVGAGAGAGERPGLLRRLFGGSRPVGVPALAALSAADRAVVARAERGEELFWCGAACWWGEMRDRLTPVPAPFRQEIDCPVEGLLPDSHRLLDSHAVVREHLARFDGALPEPEVLYKIPYMELKLRLSEHLLMRVDKCSMAHSVEARVPFLDHEVVELARRVPAAYKLKDGVGKHVLKEAARGFLDRDMIHRKKQGFGAPMEEWFREGDFARSCVDAFDRSPLRTEGLVDTDYVHELFRQQQGGGGWSFHLWTLMNVVLWHERWIG